MKKGKRRYTKKEVNKIAGTTLILFVLVCMIAYVIINASWLRPKLNEIQASYISLNNTETTDMLKVTALRKLTDEKGVSYKNKSFKEFKITGQQDSTYQIVLYHLGEKIDEKYVHYSLKNEKDKTIQDLLGNMEQTPDGGKIIFVGNVKDGKNWIIKMWIDKSYQGNADNISYEIKIKAS